VSETSGMNQQQPGKRPYSVNAPAAVPPLKGERCLTGKPGQPCPVCGKGVLDYDGWLVLGCAVCGFKEPGGSFT